MSGRAENRGMGLFKRNKKAMPALAGAAASALANGTSLAAAPVRGIFRRLRLRWRLAIGALVLASVSGAAVLGANLIYYTFTIPDPLAYRKKAQAPVVRVLARDGSVLAERGVGQSYIPLDLLPRRVTDAVIATEDRRFWEHWGLDPLGLGRAVLANLRAGRIAEGGSTLTQQLAKNMFLTPERTLSRKVEEMSLAIWLELRLSKSDILELYLNRVYFGGGAYGIEAAAQRFFAKSAPELTLAEAAVIAGLLKAPSKYAPSANRNQALIRARSVLAKMRDAGFITAAEERDALVEHVRFSDGRLAAEKAGAAFAVDYVLEELPQVSGPAGEDILVETTLDADLLRRASAIVARELDKEGEALSVSQGAVVVLDPLGAVRAIVGGRSYSDSQFNRATKARRQPGSAFKPFVYLAALERGLSPDSVVYDLPVDINGWKPRNDNGKYLGAVTMRQALAGSINSVAVRLCLEAGTHRVIETARRLGVSSALRKDASLALGTSEVSMLELAAAYAAFANGGRRVEPHVIRRIRLSNGRVLYTRDGPPARQVLAHRDVAAMNGMLSEVIKEGTGKRAALGEIQAAGKTGTSQDFRDAWFAGYTSNLVASVWVGNDDGRPTQRVAGGGLPALLWREIMLAAHEGQKPGALPGLEQPPAKSEDPAAQIAGTHPSDRSSTYAAGARAPAVRSRWLPSRFATRRHLDTPTYQAPQVVYPKEGISSNFVARAVEAGTLKRDDRTLHRPGEVDAQGGDVIVVRPPGDGLMSLGGPQR
jgi:penicillin-binding protein 1A